MKHEDDQQVSRNALCSCGSGKKYKRCCGAGFPVEMAMHRSVVSAPKVVEQINQALYCIQTGMPDVAQQILHDILKIQPKNFDALHLLGIMLLKYGQLDQALIYLHKGLKCNSSSPDIHNTLGEVYRLSKCFDQAASHYRSALKLRPLYPEALLGLGNALDSQGRSNEALLLIERALKINPIFEEGLCKLGYLLAQQEKLLDALNIYDKVLALNASLLGPQKDRAIVLTTLGRYQETERAYRQILLEKPSNGEIHYYLSLALLAQGKLPEGWKEYEWRWNWADFPSKKREFPQPKWVGDAISGRSILVWGEQGVGDEVIFSNVLPDVVAAAQRCIIECEPRLVTLFSRSFPKAEVVAKSDPPNPLTQEADVQLPINDLARWFRPNAESFPAVGGYLKADAVRADYWRERFAQLGEGVNVGISWRSKVRNLDRNRHYAEIEQLASLICVPGINWINLQYDECSEELGRIKQIHGVEIKQFDNIDLMNDLDDVAALMSALDLVISPNTSVSLLAGALGVPVWQFNVKNVNWHHMGTDRWPWFPCMKVFYREWNETWDTVINLMAEELMQFRERKEI